MAPQKITNRQINLEKEQCIFQIQHHISDFQICHRATIIKTVGYQHKDSCTDQWNATESLEINTHIHSQQIFIKVPRYTMENG